MPARGGLNGSRPTTRPTLRYRPGMTLKLFVALLAMSVLVAVAMGAAARLSFTRGFLGYLNEVGVQRMQRLAPRLADEYREHGGWDRLRHSRRDWFRLMRPSSDDGARPDTADLLPELTGANFRLGLLDADGQQVAGFRELTAEALREPVIVDGETVGWLALMPFQSLTEAADLRFLRQQRLASWLVGGAIVLLAAILAVLITQGLMRPVRGIAASTRRLADGDYGSRVDVATRDEIGRLGEDFNRLALTLERNERLRRAFIADVSHELRTPLSLLRAELEAIEDGVRPLTQASVKSLQGEVATLSKLVTDLYDLSLADLGALAYRMVAVDLVDLLDSMAAAYRGRLLGRGIALDGPAAQAPILVSADESRLRQLFANLLENCQRYVDENGRVSITVSAEGSLATVDIDDSGPGVPQQSRQQLFDRFFRMESSRNRASGGAGLGLAICRNIAEAHQGRIEALASPLGGLRIRVVLPLADCA